MLTIEYLCVNILVNKHFGGIEMASNKMVVCKNCNTPILKKAKVCPNCGVKNKKPFYKRAWFVLLVIVFAFVLLISIGGNDTEKFEWSDFELSYLLPEPESNKGRLISDLDDTLDIYVSKISKDKYDLYVEECEKKGFIIESDKTDSDFIAFNEEGYKLSLRYDDTDKEMNIELYAPKELGDLEWPVKGLGGMIPAPNSTRGKIDRDDSDYFSAIIGEMPLNQFTNYVKECENAGFNIDYNKSEGYFSAKNKDNYKVYVKYVGFNTVEVTVEILDMETEEDTTEKETDKNTDTDEIRPEFKDAMDSYEEFMNEYIEFMKKYADSNGNDLTLLSDYATYMSKYAEFVEDFEKWENEEMTAAETAYYIQVQTRVNEKLLEIAQ